MDNLTIGIWVWLPNLANVHRWEFDRNVAWEEYERIAKEMPGEGTRWKASLARV